MCFPFQWLHGSLDYATTPLLLQNKIMGDITKVTNLSTMWNILSQMTSLIYLKIEK